MKTYGNYKNVKTRSYLQRVFTFFSWKKFISE